ncbi:hypothetical protein DBIPINDM_002950 [Mesorhizobium sp. AR02]|uniref:hypothetical protein n=1 Tax=Mesorhizobium sp. AR02 TaxID=2865837 RepID=UPI002160B7DE|nr:hypothetical protein [Mesorhizobium sp. AR02]UVK56352.1 hypothetical protein DBIPINDM_002950 [Mesorhizobium sp. AR02]
MIAMVTLPTVPRYVFHFGVLSEISRRPWVYASDRAYAHEVFEPLTLISPPLTAVTYTAPSWTTQNFEQVVRRYGQEDELALIQADCDKHTVWIAQPDSSGAFRYGAYSPGDMSPDAIGLFCKKDWKAARDEWRTALKSGLTTGSINGALF